MYMAVLEEQNIAINGVGNNIFILGGLFNLCYPQTVSMKKKIKKIKNRQDFKSSLNIIVLSPFWYLTITQQLGSMKN